MPDTSPATIQEIAVEKIKPSPHQARKEFDLDAIKSLAESIKEHDLQQPINVRQLGDGYELMAGERRLRAVKLLGLPVIKAIIQSVDDSGEAAVRGLIENLQREDLNPIEEAQGYAKLQETDPKRWTQDEIAKMAGKRQSYVSEAASLLKLPQEVQDFIARAIISPTQGSLLIRLPTQEQQLQLAQQASKEGWSSRETEKRVNEALGKKPKAGNSHKPQADSSKLTASQPDPLADVWPEAKRLDANDSLVQWEVAYGSHKIPNMKGRTMDGWTFTVCPMLADQGAKELAKWLYQLSQAVAKKAGIDPTKTSFQETLELKQQTDQTLKKIFKARLPQTPEENKALEAIAIKEGPHGVYAWIYGQVNPMTQTMKQATWEQMAVTPQEGLKQILEGIEKFQGVPPTSSPAQTPQPQAEAPAFDEDAKIAAMIAKQVARGRVIR